MIVDICTIQLHFDLFFEIYDPLNYKFDSIIQCVLIKMLLTY